MGETTSVKGLLWQVGDGRNIDVFRDPWIPRLASFKVVSQSQGLSIKMENLIDPVSHQWNS